MSAADDLLDELHRYRIERIRAGKWPASSLELWGDVLDHPDDWHAVTIKRAREVMGAYEYARLHPRNGDDHDDEPEQVVDDDDDDDDLSLFPLDDGEAA